MSYKLTEEELAHHEQMKKTSSRFPLLKEPEHIELVIRFQAGNKQAGEKLLYHNLRLIMSVALKNVGRGVPLGDLCQEGSIGFMRGITKFDHLKGFKLSTYTTWWIRQAITRAIENKGKLIRIPSHKLQQANKVKWAHRQYLEKRVEDPDEDEDEKAAPNAKDLTKYCNLTEEQILESRRYLQDHVSLNQLCGGGEEHLTLEDYLGASPEGQPEEQVERAVDQSYFKDVFDQLDEEERNFVLLRFGFLDGVERDRKQMGQCLKKTLAEVQQLEDHIFAKLRGLINVEELNNA